MKKKHSVLKALAFAAGAAAAAAVVRQKLSNRKTLSLKGRTQKSTTGQAYFIGGGLASLAGAAYLIRDAGYNGSNIHIFEGMHVLGGSNDGAGNAEDGFICRGGRMLNEETYENFWELMESIPSLEIPNKSVTEEILNFDHLHPTHAQARLVTAEGKIVDVTKMGFNMKDRLALGKLLITPEEKLDDMTIAEWFANTPHFFETNFWYMWQTTFAFQKWSSLFEFKRYMNRMIFEFSRIETLEGVTRTTYNQYESVILPLKAYLEKHGVEFNLHATVTDLDFEDDDTITVTGIHYMDENKHSLISIGEDDICIMTNGCMTDCATLGDYEKPAPFLPEHPISGDLWRKIAAKKSGLGNPEPFFSKPEECNWESFTVTSHGNKLLKAIEQFSGNIPGSGALMTFKDSGWLMSIVIAAQPHFKNQPSDTTILWGYGLHTSRNGDYVQKPMRDCNGKEMLTELIYQLHMEDHLDEFLDDIVNVIPCMMPYVDAQFEPRKMSDRPNVVPVSSTNFAMISQFVEIPKDMVFTEEYSVRSARIAVYTLLGITDREICPVTPHNQNPAVLLKALKKAFS